MSHELSTRIPGVLNLTDDERLHYSMPPFKHFDVTDNLRRQLVKIKLKSGRKLKCA